MTPFVVYSLPRSRTAWLANWLSRATSTAIGHDLAIWADTIDDWLDHLWRCRLGTVETGAVEAWPILCRAMPKARLAVIRRPLGEVEASLLAAGFPIPPDDTLRRRAAALDALAERPGVLVLDHTQLDDPEQANRLHRQCLGTDMDEPLWQQIQALHVTVRPEPRLQVLTERHDRIERLKAELRDRLAEHTPWVTVGVEPWDAVAEEVDALGAGHHAEVGAAIEGAYRLDLAVMTRMAQAGQLAAVVARVDAVMAGYCLWTLSQNAESDAPPTLMQGPFYVVPEHARHRLGRRMLTFSAEYFGRLGARCLRLHHTVYGRGARAGRLYAALGAVEHQREYLLAVGE